MAGLLCNQLAAMRIRQYRLVVKEHALVCHPLGLTRRGVLGLEALAYHSKSAAHVVRRSLAPRTRVPDITQFSPLPYRQHIQEASREGVGNSVTLRLWNLGRTQTSRIYSRENRLLPSSDRCGCSLPAIGYIVCMVFDSTLSMACLHNASPTVSSRNIHRICLEGSS